MQVSQCFCLIERVGRSDVCAVVAVELEAVVVSGLVSGWGPHRDVMTVGGLFPV